MSGGFGFGYVRTDLHGHSLYSDGRATPEEYVGLRGRKRFDVVALTDHDTFAGVERAAAAARKQPGLTLVPAMEATATLHFGQGERAEQVHVLAYFPPSFLDDNGARLKRTRLAARAQRVHAAWRAYVLDFVSRQSAEVRAALGESELRAFPAGSDHEFPQLQSFILRIGERAPDEFKSFQLDHVHFWENRELFGWSPEELIDQIRADGAVDVVAHPVRYRDRARMDAVLKYAGGIEAFSSRHTADVAARYRTLAEALGKHWTASTDDHQHRPYVPPASGTPKRTVEWILAGGGR